MNEIKSTAHTFQITVTHALYKKLKEEYTFKSQPFVAYAVIGKLIQCIEKKFKSVELNYKGD